MKRREFLQSLLAGAAILTTPQRLEIEKQVEQLPPGKPVEKVDYEVTRSQWTLNWRESVKLKADLPLPAQECDACFCEENDTVWIYVDHVDWVQLTTPGPTPDAIPYLDASPQYLGIFAEERDGHLFVNLFSPRPMRSKIAPDKTVNTIGLTDLQGDRETLLRNIGEIAVAVGRGDEELPY